MKSLQQRLHLGLTSSLVILMGAMWWLTSASIAHISQEVMLSRLEHDGEALLTALMVNKEQLQLKPESTGGIYSQVFSGHYYLVLSGSQTLRSRSLWDEQLVSRLMAPGKSDYWQATGPNHQPLLFHVTGYRRYQQDITIIVAEDLSPLHESLAQFNRYFALGVFLILLILLAVQHQVIVRSFRSLNRVRDELKQLSSGNLTSLSEEVPTEVQPLVSEVNHLLQLLSQRLQRSRNAMGNLAHALKHPLNLIMQLTRDDALKPHPELTSELNKNTQQIHQLMERELKRAQFSGAAIPGQRFVPSEELPTLIDVLQRVYRDKALNIESHIDEPMECQADRNDMLELLGNLLDNACKWASGQVTCTLQKKQGLQITIEDDGSGCDNEQLQRLTQRGVRIDESVSGHGLGLAIVKEIVELYEGTITFGHSATLGGLEVRVVLPDN